jgi:GntR family transcriptional regulator
MAAPKYQEISAQLQAEILALAPGTLLPNERELASRFAVSRMTVRQAMQTLTAAGLVTAVRGHGTFVADPRITKRPTMSSFTQDMLARNLRPGARLLSAKEVAAGPVIGRDLEIDEAATVIRLERLRIADSQPMCIEVTYLPAALLPGLLELDLTMSLYELLYARFRVRLTHSDAYISAVALSRQQADLLAVKPRSPALLIRVLGQDHRKRMIERTETTYRADRFNFRVTIDDAEQSNHDVGSAREVEDVSL